MASKTVYTTSCTIRCPSCLKSMLLKNWKDHARQMHTMLPAVIDANYNELKRDIEKSRLSTVTSAVTTVIEQPTPVPIKTLFSMKKFALTKSTNSNVQMIDNSSQMNQSDVVELVVANTSFDSVTQCISPSSPDSSTAFANTVEFDHSFSHHESINLAPSTPLVNNILSNINQTDGFSKDPNLLQHDDNESLSETTTDDESEDSEVENDLVLTSLTTESVANITPTRSLIMFIHIEGVRFITNEELNFIDSQREKHPSIQWFTEDKQKQVKPSRYWFLKDHLWLRAVCSNHRYGLLCIDCAQFATDKTLIERNNGAFIVRPYWKLKHKGLYGIKKHENSDLHRESRARRIASEIVKHNGNIIGQLNCVNLENQTKKYLSVLLRTLWFILKGEIALGKFKSFLELLHKVECPAVVEWLNLSNMKQRYWSHEATSEWLISIDNYINHRQISSLKQTEFINLIIDETTDISVKQMICICLRYVEKEDGVIREEVFKLGPIHDQSGEGIFYVVEEFIDNLQKQTGKQFIITAQTYDGAACMRFQLQGHVQGRLSAWAIYIYCRSHLLNLSIKDAIDYSFYDAFDTIKSALIFLNDSPQRLEILFNSQKLVGSSKKGHSVPKPSITRWSYSYEIVKFACRHYSAIILTFTTLSQSKSNGSSDGRRYATDLLKPKVAFQIHLLRDVLRPAMQFLRQIEKRGSCLDQFALSVSAARETISEAMNSFDFTGFRTALNNIKDFTSTVPLTSHSTRLQQQATSIDIDENELRQIGNDFVQNVLKSLDNRFHTKAQEIIENLCVFSSPSNQSPEDLLNNMLIQKYTSPITYTHKGVDGKIYERTDKPLLNLKYLKDDVYAFRTITEGVTTIPAILLKLAKFGSEQCPEWYRFYQILGTFAIGSNEAERMFSTLRRIKTWLRNRLSDNSVETLLKLSALDIQLTDDAVDFIVQDFVKNPGRAKSRNIALFLENDQLNENDDEHF